MQLLIFYGVKTILIYTPFNEYNYNIDAESIDYICKKRVKQK